METQTQKQNQHSREPEKGNQQSLGTSFSPPEFRLEASPVSENSSLNQSETQGQVLSFEATVPKSSTNSGTLGEPANEISLGDISFGEMAGYDQHDAVSGTINYGSSIKKGGATPSGFGVTRPSQSIKGIKIKSESGVYKLKFKIKRDMKYTARASLGPGGQKNIKGAKSKHLKQSNYKTAVSDLTPNMADLNGRPPRTNFWSKHLTLVHEKFHAKEDVKFGKDAIPTVQKWLNLQTANSVSDCKNLIVASGRKVETEVAKGMAFPGREERAYGDGAPKYSALAKEINDLGSKGKYPA